MPELPEIETIRLALEPRIVGRRLDEVEIRDPRLVRPFEPHAVAVRRRTRLVGLVEPVGRRRVHAAPATTRSPKSASSPAPIASRMPRISSSMKVRLCRVISRLAVSSSALTR